MSRLRRFIEFVWVLFAVLVIILWVLPDFIPRRKRRSS
jgi:hypothetical protein